jgi:hypothetical protein
MPTEIRDISLDANFDAIIENGDFALSSGIIVVTQNGNIYLADCDRAQIQILTLAQVGAIKHAPKVGAGVAMDIESEDTPTNRTRFRNRITAAIESGGKFKISAFSGFGEKVEIDYRRIAL